MEADRFIVGRDHELIPVPSRECALGTRRTNWTSTHCLGDTLLLSSKARFQGVPHYQEHRKSFAHGSETYREEDRGGRSALHAGTPELRIRTACHAGAQIRQGEA